MTVVFGPYVGEFGWEVRAWAPHVYARVVRMRVAGDQTPVTIIAKEGSRALYEPALALKGVEFCTREDWPKEPAEYMHLHHPGAQRAWEERLDEQTSLLKIAAIRPKPGLAFAESCLEDIKKHGYEANPTTQSGYMIAICRRDRADLAPERNYQRWDDLRDHLVDTATPHNWVSKTWSCVALDDLRSAPVAVGESSGPMHLAITAGVPIVTWGKPGTREKYEHDNWHGVPMRIIDGLQPEPQAIADAVADLLEEVSGGV
ncbi:MAG: hypothetical protein ACIAQU_04330 [Phycisphaerales bacterium JB064]